MAHRVLYPNAIDYFREIHHNVVQNIRGKRTSYVLLPSLYQRAYILTHETGELPVTDNFVAPDESLTQTAKAGVSIITGK